MDVERPNYAPPTRQTNTQPKRTMKRQKDEGQVSFDYRGEGIQGAPPLATDLPWDCIAEITSYELIVFFPNHALHVGAITARLLAEGWPQGEIPRLLHLSRGLGPDPPAKNQLALANTVRVSLRTNEKKFVEQDLERDFVKGSVTQEEIETTPWRWTRSPRATLQLLRPPWTIAQIASAFPGDLLALPDFGPFTRQVKEARQFQDLMEEDMFEATSAGWNCFPPQNPPPLPQDWSIGMHNGFKAVSLFDKSSQHMATSGRGKLPDLQSTLARFGHDADNIMAQGAHLLTGEVLLYFVSRYGFKKTVADLAISMATHMPKGTPPLGRTTFSHRIRKALEARAKVNGRLYEDEWNLFREHERYVENDNQRKDRPKPTRRRPAALSIAPDDAEGDLEGEYDQSDGHLSHTTAAPKQMQKPPLGWKIPENTLSYLQDTKAEDSQYDGHPLFDPAAFRSFLHDHDNDSSIPIDPQLSDNPPKVFEESSYRVDGREQRSFLKLDPSLRMSQQRLSACRPQFSPPLAAGGRKRSFEGDEDYHVDIKRRKM